ncbi:uncharacterized protein BDV17DRAFT_243974 [Aspergillus undulatus]|uniref:uncharacterized protein n=1 Tax=Aspergillus undulatus TaxID=1810928 RepID=UPI003CCC95AE
MRAMHNATFVYKMCPFHPCARPSPCSQSPLPVTARCHYPVIMCIDPVRKTK